MHPRDIDIIEDLKKKIDMELKFEYPPGPFFGPLKDAKIVFLYGNPGVDDESDVSIQDNAHRSTLFAQLKGTEPYPFKIPGWEKWFSNKFNQVFEFGSDNTKREKIARIISVFNLIPYASVNMDKLNTVAHCLPSVWEAQIFLRNTLIPNAKEGKLLLVVSRSSHLWGIKTTYRSENILINGARHGFDDFCKKRIREFYDNL